MIGGEYFRWGAVVIVGTNKNEGATLPFLLQQLSEMLQKLSVRPRLFEM